MRAGNTFVTVGPLIEFAVEGRPAGSRIALPGGGGTVEVTWSVASVRVPIEQIEIVVGGMIAEVVSGGNSLSASGSASVAVGESTWVALRVRGSYRGTIGDIAAHSSAVQIVADDRPLFVEADATAVLEQIEGAMAYVDTLAPRPEAMRFRALRATLEGAHNRLHQRLHREGIYHQHGVATKHRAPSEPSPGELSVPVKPRGTSAGT